MAYRQWETGKCKRGHDITDPANVKTRRSDGVRICVACQRIRALADEERKEKKHYPPRTCQQCHRRYTISSQPDPAKARAYWNRRKYCGERCRNTAANIRGQVTKKPLSDAEVARLRRLVGIGA